MAFSSGAKSSEQKPRYDLIPASALEREAIRMAEGAAAHGENNYQKGAADEGFIRDRINHLIEHAVKYAAGDRSTDHLAAVRCNAGMLIWLEEYAPVLSQEAHAIPASIEDSTTIPHGHGYGWVRSSESKMGCGSK